MDWIPVVIGLIAVYAVIAYVIHARKIFANNITFYGPVMAIRTVRVKFFDRFIALRTFLRLYGTFGVLMVIVVSVFITAMLVLSVRYTLIIRPEPTGIYEPQNILLLPGINERVLAGNRRLDMESSGISIVLGTYNRKPYLKNTIAQVRREISTLGVSGTSRAITSRTA